MRGTIHLIMTGLIMILFCGPGFAEENIVVCGTGDSQELLRILANAYSSSHPGSVIDVPDSVGSSGGIRATAEGQCDMGRVARKIKDKEKKYGLNYKLFALSPVVFAANASVMNVGNLTSKQIVDIYSGQLTEWSVLGGRNGKIYVANREDGDSSRSVLENNLPGFKEIKEFAGKTIYSTPETVEIIQHYDGTLGYTSLASAKNTGLKIMKIDGISPSEENVKSGKYSLVSPFGLVWKGELKGLSLDFLNYISGGEASNIIKDNGGVPAL